MQLLNWHALLVSSHYIAYWELSAEEKVHEFCKSVSICECFLALFILAEIFIYEIA